MDPKKASKQAKNGKQMTGEKPNDFEEQYQAEDGVQIRNDDNRGMGRGEIVNNGQENVEDQNREEIEEDESGDDEPQVIDYTPKEMYLLEKKGEFPKKTYIIEECFKSYTAVLHFFESQMIFDQSPFASHVNFICKECKKDMDIIWPKFSNLNRHLRLDCIEKAKTWYLIFAKNYGKILRPTHQSTQLIEFNN